MQVEDWHQQGQQLIHITENPVDVLNSLQGQLCGDINLYYPHKRHAYFNIDSCILFVLDDKNNIKRTFTMQICICDKNVWPTFLNSNREYNNFLFCFSEQLNLHQDFWHDVILLHHLCVNRFISALYNPSIT